MGESVHSPWVVERREQGLLAQSDSELYEVFDITYEYDIWPLFQKAVRGQLPITQYLEILHLQKGIYPHDFIKLRCVENHDNPRITAITPDEISAKAWTAFQVFNQGAFLMYAGQEAGATRTPSLFEIDKIFWGNVHLTSWYKCLFELKKSELFVHGHQHFIASDPVIQVEWKYQESHLLGFFNVFNRDKDIPCDLPDGEYMDLLTDQIINISNKRINISNLPCVIFHIPPEITPNRLASKWLGSI